MGSHRRMARMYRRGWAYSFEQTMFGSKVVGVPLDECVVLKEKILNNIVDLVVTDARTDNHILNNVVVNAPLGSLQHQFKPVARKTCCMSTIMVSMGIV